MDFMQRLCERLIVMADGQVLVEGEPREVLENTEVQAAYLGSVTA